LNELSTVKVLHAKPDQQLSLQRHAKRAEYWYILSGDGIVTIDGVEHPANAGNEFEIAIGATHRIKAGASGIWWVEVAVGAFDEHDEERLADDYGRGSPAP
jgi:mannose-6-phosphate isomerase-like protein (cupin superfamily)